MGNLKEKLVNFIFDYSSKGLSTMENDTKQEMIDIAGKRNEFEKVVA